MCILINFVLLNLNFVLFNGVDLKDDNLQFKFRFYLIRCDLIPCSYLGVQKRAYKSPEYPAQGLLKTTISIFIKT